MATIQIIQIPTQQQLYTGTNTFDECLPTNYFPILPVTVQVQDNLAIYFKVKFILRVYKDSVSDANLLATLKQRTNNFSTTTDQVAMFDLQGIVNTQLGFTYRDADNVNNEVHSIGNHDNDQIFTRNQATIKTIVVVATWEKSDNANDSPVEQTGDTVTMTMFFAPSTFRLFKTVDPSTNPLNSYFINNLGSQVLTNTPINSDFRVGNRASTGILLRGRLNYVSASSCYHTIAFLNKSGWGSDGQYIILKYYDSNSTQVGNTYAIENNTTQGGVLPASANSDDKYMIFAGVGTKNLNFYVGDAYKDTVAISTFDGQPNNVSGWSYYTIHLANATSGTDATRKSQQYIFIKDDTVENTSSFSEVTNCKGQVVVRLAWVNELGGWDYYNFRGGQVETMQTERIEYSSILGAEQLSDNNIYRFDTWGQGKRTLKTNTTLKARLQTQFITEEESKYLEPLFSSPAVMVIDNNMETTTFENAGQSVIVTSKSYERKTSPKNKLEIQYTFEIEYANKLSTIS